MTQAGWAGLRGEAELFPQPRPRALQEPSLQEQGQGQDTLRAPFWGHLLQGNTQHSGARFELQNSNFPPKSSACPRGITWKQHSGISKPPPSRLAHTGSVCFENCKTSKQNVKRAAPICKLGAEEEPSHKKKRPIICLQGFGFAVFPGTYATGVILKGCLLQEEPSKQQSHFLSDLNIRLPCEQEKKNPTPSASGSTRKGEVGAAGEGSTAPTPASQGGPHSLLVCNEREWPSKGSGMLSWKHTKQRSSGWILPPSSTHPWGLDWIFTGPFPAKPV